MFIDVNKEKRGVLIYITSLLWLLLGATATYFAVPLVDMSVYFLSLTGFVSSYVWGEGVRPSTETSIFSKGETSAREKMIYITILLWIIVAAFGFYRKLNFVELAAYYGSLTPFVGAFILGRSYQANTNTDIKS